ncbi:DUF2799 domain-containing protein [Leucothrix pacifica]|uniref:DUF2799 domain-containing protein n=1 Tax=Leucothrix pacifica TaxID=1247513 RepID=A0A317CHU4_9GAMM|nr:DUF2799 domain-containing protein [Leucothrix pacifica]PWQ97711.1 hypothetical protein DKW60_10080 [Leucothrix pacifica]
MLSPTRINSASTHKSILSLALLLAIIFLINGCATLNKNDCREGNWAGIGFNDAVAGLRSDIQLNSHIKACSRYKIGHDQIAYDNGYNRGLQQFCTQSSGMRYGSDNNKYYNICPAHLKSDFLIGYVSGLTLSINHLQNEIEDLRHERRKKDRKLSTLGKENRKDKKSHKEIKKLKDSIENIEDNLTSKRSTQNDLRAWYSLWSRQI